MDATMAAGRTGAQKATIGLTATSAVLILVASVLVWSQLNPVQATPGIVEFVVLAVLIAGMVRRQKIAFLGTLGAKVIFVLGGLGAFVVVRPEALTLSWFGLALALNIILGLAIIYSAWRSLRQM